MERNKESKRAKKNAVVWYKSSGLRHQSVKLQESAQMLLDYFVTLSA